MKARQLAVFLALAFPLTISADDYNPPSWRGQPATTTQRWGFLTAATLTPPDSTNNPYGLPGASITAPATWSSAEHIYSGIPTVVHGVWDISPGGSIDLTIPNAGSVDSSGELWIQVTYVTTASAVSSHQRLLCDRFRQWRTLRQWRAH